MKINNKASVLSMRIQNETISFKLHVYCFLYSRLVRPSSTVSSSTAATSMATVTMATVTMTTTTTTVPSSLKGSHGNAPSNHSVSHGVRGAGSAVHPGNVPTCTTNLQNTNNRLHLQLVLIICIMIN